jgi:hypothetical protein
VSTRIEVHRHHRGRQGRRAGRGARRRGRSAAAWILRSPDVLEATAVSWPRSGHERRELGGRQAGGGRGHRVQGLAWLLSWLSAALRPAGPASFSPGTAAGLEAPDLDALCAGQGRGPGPCQALVSALDLRALTAGGAVGCRSGWEFRPVSSVACCSGWPVWPAFFVAVLLVLPPVSQCAELGCQDGGPGRWEPYGWRACQGLRCWPVAMAVWTVRWPASSVLC